MNQLLKYHLRGWWATDQLIEEEVGVTKTSQKKFSIWKNVVCDLFIKTKSSMFWCYPWWCACCWSPNAEPLMNSTAVSSQSKTTIRTSFTCCIGIWVTLRTKTLCPVFLRWWSRFLPRLQAFVFWSSCVRLCSTFPCTIMVKVGKSWQQVNTA